MTLAVTNEPRRLSFPLPETMFLQRLPASMFLIESRSKEEENLRKWCPFEGGGSSEGGLRKWREMSFSSLLSSFMRSTRSVSRLRQRLETKSSVRER